jgi:hypothetical protein
MANDKAPAGKAAATASGEYQSKKIRSVNCITVQESVETISGNASTKTSRMPLGPRQKREIRASIRHRLFLTKSALADRFHPCHRSIEVRPPRDAARIEPR